MAVRALRRLLVLGFLLVFSACTSEEPGADQPAETALAPVDGGTLRVAAGAEPDVLNSLITTSGYSGRILALVNDGLVGMNENLEWEPALAESWTWSADGLALTFHLRAGVRWSDGEPFSAYDVQRSYELFIDSRIASSRRSNFEDIESMTAVDSHTVRVDFIRRSRDQLFNANLSLLPAHVVDDLDPAEVESWSLNRDPVGLGPFRLERWDAGERMVLVRNPHYWGPASHLDRVVFLFTPDPTVRLLRLETGEVDMLEDIPLKDYERIRRTSPEIRIYPVSGRRFGYLNYNVRNPFLADARVRRAISHAVDRRAFTENLMYGHAQPAASIIVPALAWAHDAELAPHALDRAEAARLLAEAGFADDDGDGVLDRDGVPFEIRITTRTGDPVRENGILILQENLARVGIRVKLRLMEMSAALDEVRSGDYDVYYGHFNSRLSVDPTILVTTGGALNYGGYSDAGIDSLVAAGVGELDDDRARRIWKDFQARFHQEQPWTILYYYDSLVGIRDVFHGCTPHNLSPFYGLEGWWKEPEERDGA
jgi:peptide/nickel transport system substrate-binding protein